MYRLLALDLDGTLLRDDHTVDPRDVAAIAELQAAGVTVTIVTGRLHTGSIEAARACAIEGAIGCVEGSHIVSTDGVTIHAHHALAAADIERVRGVVEGAGLAGYVFHADGIHYRDGDGAHRDYVRTWSPVLRGLGVDEVWGGAPLGGVCIGPDAAVAAAHGELARHADRLFAVRFAVRGAPGTSAVLFRTAGPHKGTALAELCKLAGCTTAEAVVVGDWINDVPMFRAAGRSFVMASAPDEVRAEASDELETHAGAGGGIAEAIRRAF
jgi:hydroxymethylpyrimidine pyrophosphatase-like HAD family hydrolase